MRTGPLRVAARMPEGPRRVEVELTNVGDAPLVVNERLAPGYRDSSSRELFADVFAPGTDTLVSDEAMDYERHPPQRDDYRELAPGEALTADSTSSTGTASQARATTSSSSATRPTSRSRWTSRDS